jgi:hypothetical protein
MPERMTPEELAATLEQTATWMATRPAGVTWTGDGLDGTVAGLRDAAGSIRKQLGPAWDALTRDRDAAQAANAAFKKQLLEAKADQAEAIRERAAGRQADVRPDADEPGWLHVTCGGCGVEFGTNFAVEELECPECEARRCPECQAWFGSAS